MEIKNKIDKSGKVKTNQQKPLERILYVSPKLGDKEVSNLLMDSGKDEIIGDKVVSSFDLQDE